MPPIRRVVVALVGCLHASALGQTTPTLHVSFRAGAVAARPAALAQLCNEYLPHRPEWPAGLAATAAFTVTIGSGGLGIRASSEALPPTTLAMATLALPDGTIAFGSCSDDGTEDWFAPPTTVLPAPWESTLRELAADSLNQPRTIDAAVLIGHLAGALVDEDPHQRLVHLGAMCGEVTFTAWRTPDHLRLRGRSDGGLLLPALLVTTLRAAGRSKASALPLRAFAGRDPDQAEAVRQLLLGEEAATVQPLRALLHANDDPMRLSAIDTLVRRGAAAELPYIVAAATPAMPLATMAAADAVRALWPAAAPSVRQQTRSAIARCQVIELRRLDLDQMVPVAVEAAPVDSEWQAQVLLLLLISGIGLYGFWLRERRTAPPRRGLIGATDGRRV